YIYQSKAYTAPTSTTARLQTEPKARYILSAAKLIHSRANNPPIILKPSAMPCIPFLLVFEIFLGIVPSFPNDQSMRVDAHHPELAAEIMAVRTTKFIISAA